MPIPRSSEMRYMEQTSELHRAGNGSGSHHPEWKMSTAHRASVRGPRRAWSPWWEMNPHTNMAVAPPSKARFEKIELFQITAPQQSSGIFIEIQKYLLPKSLKLAMPGMQRIRDR